MTGNCFSHVLFAGNYVSLKAKRYIFVKQCHMRQYFRRRNRYPVKLVKHGGIEETTSERVCVGDIISLNEDDVVPCDAIVLSTAHESHQVKYVSL